MKENKEIIVYEFEVGNKNNDFTDYLYLGIPRECIWDIIYNLIDQVREGNDKYYDLLLSGKFKMISED